MPDVVMAMFEKPRVNRYRYCYGCFVLLASAAVNLVFERDYLELRQVSQSLFLFQKSFVLENLFHKSSDRKTNLMKCVAGDTVEPFCQFPIWLYFELSQDSFGHQWPKR